MHTQFKDGYLCRVQGSDLKYMVAFAQPQVGQARTHPVASLSCGHAKLADRKVTAPPSVPTTKQPSIFLLVAVAERQCSARHAARDIAAILKGCKAGQRQFPLSLAGRY